MTLAAMIGCGNGTARPSTAPAQASEACATLHAAWSELEARCVGGSVADWLAYNGAIEHCPSYDALVASGKVVYHRDKWQGCVDEFRTACDHFHGACFFEVLEGQVADGAPCSTEVCGVGSECLNFATDGCGAQCTRLAALGEDCNARVCAKGLACSSGICATPRRLGESCEDGPAAVACDALLFCDAAFSGGPGTCAARVAGGACLVDSQCDVKEFCLAGACTARRAAGMPCGDAPTGCVAWTICDTTLSWTCVPAGRPGLRCALVPGSDFPGMCAGGDCGPADTCRPISQVGDSCAETQLCLPGSTCDPSSARCTACETP